jgi:hypothetical protein
MMMMMKMVLGSSQAETMMRKVAALSALVALAAFPAAATDGSGFMNGTGLYDKCRTQGGRLFLRGYMAGFVDTHSLITALNSSINHLCVPIGVETEQLTDIACKYLSEHPEERHYPGAGLALVAALRLSHARRARRRNSR